MNLKQLEYFVSVAETLSFTKTAEKFFISQTAITQQIKALEEQLDVVLLTRTKRNVKLTPAGSVFLQEAKAILTRTENAIKRTQKTATGFSGVLNIGIVEGYEDPTIPEIFRKFRTKYPNISLTLKEANVGDLYTSMLNLELDVVINLKARLSRLEDYDISYKSIGAYKLMVLLPPAHPLAFRDVLDLTELKNDNFIITGTQKEKDSFGHYESTINHFNRMGFTPNIIQTSDSFRTTALMVAANIGVAILPSYALSGSNNMHSHHVTIPLNNRADTLEIVIARYNQNTNTSVDKFWSYF